MGTTDMTEFIFEKFGWTRPLLMRSCFTGVYKTKPYDLRSKSPLSFILQGILVF